MLQVAHTVGQFGNSVGGATTDVYTPVQNGYPAYGNGYGGNYPDGHYYPPSAPHACPGISAPCPVILLSPLSSRTDTLVVL